MRRLLLIIIVIDCLAIFSLAQETATYQVRVSLDHDDWKYKLDQPAKFTFGVELNGQQASGVELKYSCGPEFMPPAVSKTVTTTDKPFTIEAAPAKEPGFYRCVATVDKDGKTFRGLATAAYDPESIKPVVTDPADFDKFWNDGKAKLAKIPIDAKMEPLASYSTAKVDVYQVSFQNIGTGISPTSRIYGILAIPKGSPGQKFPALLNVPGAGVRPYKGAMELANRGIITLQIGIHGMPVTLDQSVYDALREGALNRYMLYNLDDKETYYYRRVYLGCLRALDFLTSVPQYDGSNLGVMGGSQGGGLSIAVAALDPRIKVLAASYPALGDQIAYASGRAGGWPHAFKDPAQRTKEKLDTAQHYDTVNFARRIKVPGIYTWGFNDEVVPPTSSYAEYSVITAPKTLVITKEMGHANSPEQTARINDFLEKFLKEGKAQ